MIDVIDTETLEEHDSYTLLARKRAFTNAQGDGWFEDYERTMIHRIDSILRRRRFTPEFP